MKEAQDVGSKRSPTATAAAAAAAAGAVCCMCGDHGLPQELFRCKFCRVRLQHRYCSDLYPRLTACRSCNWCLRDQEGGSRSLQVQHLIANRKLQPKPNTISSNHGDREGCSRSTFSPEPGKPLKKPKADGRSVAAAPGTAKRKNLREGEPRFRVKVQRYKLLEEVISC